MAGLRLDLVTALSFLKIWLKKKPKPIHWLFFSISLKKYLDRHLCARSASEIVKFAVRQSGKPWPLVAQYSGHSLRIGASRFTNQGALHISHYEGMGLAVVWAPSTGI